VIAFWKTIIWQQFGAAIDMLENGLVACPDQLWSDRSREPEYWYVLFHTLFFLDLYLSDSVEGFSPPTPFTLDELDPRGLIPEHPYTKEELRNYLEHGRRKCRLTIEALTDGRAVELLSFGSIEGSRAELLLYNLRHVQHHAAQLNLLLRQTTGSAPGWVARAKSNP
jgi:hypothetical protein